MSGIFSCTILTDFWEKSDVIGIWWKFLGMRPIVKKTVLLIVWQNGLFKIAKFLLCMCKKGPFLSKNLEESFIRKCQTFIFQQLFSEFDYLYYFWSYFVMKCCKRDKSYCNSIDKVCLKTLQAGVFNWFDAKIL